VPAPHARKRQNSTGVARCTAITGGGDDGCGSERGSVQWLNGHLELQSIVPFVFVIVLVRVFVILVFNIVSGGISLAGSNAGGRNCFSHPGASSFRSRYCIHQRSARRPSSITTDDAP
jgi:hypothetical protein